VPSRPTPAGAPVPSASSPLRQPTVIVNGLAAILFMIGYVLLGIAMIRAVTLPSQAWGAVCACGSWSCFPSRSCPNTNTDAHPAGREVQGACGPYRVSSRKCLLDS
jgi:hypothetical protein